MNQFLADNINPKIMAEKLPDATIEKEFLNFVQKLRTRHPSHGVSYQLNNYPEGIECTFRIARLTNEQDMSGSFASRASFGENSGLPDLGISSCTSVSTPILSKPEIDESLTEEEKAEIEARRSKKAAKLKLKRLQFRERQKLKKMQAHVANIAEGNGEQAKSDNKDETIPLCEKMEDIH